MTPIMLPIRRGTVASISLRTPYSRPRPLRLRPLSDSDVEYMISRFKESYNAARYRPAFLDDWEATGPPRPILGPL